MVKGERRKKREEIRRIVAEDEKRRKEQAVKKSQPRKANYRKDRDGNIILWGNVKFSKLSIAVLMGIVGIAVFFYVVSTGVGEMDGYIEPEFSFEACQDDGFTKDMCKFYYKHCRTYATGEQICEYAEENPFVDMPDLGDKWTEEEQDFLPPTEYLPFLQYAEARGADEPTCYSTACKVDNPNADGNKKDVDKTVAEAKQDLDDLKDDITDLTKQINDWELDSMDWRNDLREKEDALEDAEDEYDEAKKEHRHAMDVKPQNTDDIEMQDDAREKFKDATKQLKIAQKEYAIEKSRYDQRMDDLRETKNELIHSKDSLDIALEDVTTARVNANRSAQGDNKFINIVLSNSCLTLIENNMTTNCPTYRELKGLYDNTLEHVSGKFVDHGYDIKREDPKYKNYWKYYQALPNWKIITVDPDAEIMQRGVTITIQATEFTYLENMKSYDKTPSYNQTKSERYEWHNVKYHDHCSKVMMAPDLDLLPDIINNIWDNCEKQEPNVIELFFEDMETKDSQWYAYSTWLTDAMERCLTKC
jgi:hypothetical protein